MALKPPVDVTDTQVTFDEAVALPDDRDIATYSSELGRVSFGKPADVVFNSLNYGRYGYSNTGAVSIGTALDQAIEDCFDDYDDPVDNSRIANRQLHIPPGTYMRNDGNPVLDIRSVVGFNLRTGGPYAVIFDQRASADAVVKINGFSRCHFGGFSFQAVTAGTVVDNGVWMYWNSGVGVDPLEEANRSTTGNRFEFIEGGGRCVNCMQIGRDGDSNQVDTISFGHVRLLGGTLGGLGQVSSGVNTITNYAGDTLTTALHQGWIITGYGIPAGTTISSVSGTTITMSANATQTYTNAGFRFNESGLNTSGLKIGTGTFGNNYGHTFDLVQSYKNASGILLAASGTEIGHADVIGNAVDIDCSGTIISGAIIHSLRSEQSLQLLNSGGSTVMRWLSLRDARFAASQMRGDGIWVSYQAPGKLELDAHCDSPPSGMAVANPFAAITPTRRLILQGNISSGISASEVAETSSFSFSSSVITDIKWVPNQAFAVPAGGRTPTVASASTITLPWSTDFILISGTTAVNNINAAGHDGQRKTLMTQGACTFNHLGGGTGNLRLDGDANKALTANDLITFVCDGTLWHQASPVITKT